MRPIAPCVLDLIVVSVMLVAPSVFRLQCIFKSANVFVDVEMPEDVLIPKDTMIVLDHETFGGYSVVYNNVRYPGNPLNTKHRILMINETKLFYCIGGTSIGWSCLNKYVTIANQHEGMPQPPFVSNGWVDDKVTIVIG